MKATTAAEMREIDQTATQLYGIPGIVLMENAGGEIARKIQSILGEVPGKKVCIFAGKGNNGGDGYVVARHLFNQGAKVKVFLLGSSKNITGDAKINLDIITNMEINILEITSERDWDQVKIAVAFADCLLDGILGTGFRGAIDGEVARAIEIMNNSGRAIVAVDIPSGVDANTGQVRGGAVKACHTVTLGLPKPGLLLYPGAAYAGVITVANIGLPSSLLLDNEIKQNMITAAEVRNLLPPRQADAHKGSCGKVLIVAGSQGLTGAAALSSQAALRAGAGLVTLGIGESLHDIMEAKLTEVMTKPLPEIIKGAIGRKAVPYIEEFAGECNVLAIGPGIGRQEETMTAVRELVKSVSCPLVIDADGLQSLVGFTEILPDLSGVAVLTPHPGEMARLIGLSPERINQDRIGIARQAAGQWGSIVVLKGARTVIAFPDGEVYINTTGNAGMATGGTGDVLTGVIAAFIAQGLSSHAAAVAGVYIHGLAGDIAAHNGGIGLTASDVIQALPAAILGIQTV